MNTETYKTMRCYCLAPEGIQAVTVSVRTYRQDPDLFSLIEMARWVQQLRIRPRVVKPRVAPRTAVGVVRAEGGAQ